MKKTIFPLLMLICTGLFGQASLPASWDMSNISTPPTGWSYNLNVTVGNLIYTGAGFFNSAPQAIRLDGSGENLQLFFSGRADTVEYYVRHTGTTGSPTTAVFNIEESTDGNTWTITRNYSGAGASALPGALTKHITRLKPTSRYVRFIYTTKQTNFNVSLDDVLVKPAGPSSSPEIAVLDGSNPIINGGTYQSGNSGLFPLTLKNNGIGDSLKIDSIRFPQGHSRFQSGKHAHSTYRCSRRFGQSQYENL